MKHAKKALLALALLLATGLFVPVTLPESQFGTVRFGAYLPSLTETLFAQNNPNTLNSLDRRLVHYAFGVLTTAQTITLGTTAFTVIPAQGAGTIIEPLGGLISYHYVTTAFTVDTGWDLKLWFTNRVTGPAASDKIEMTGVVDQTADKATNFQGVPTNEIISTNVAVALQATSGAGGLTGGGASTLAYRVAYRVHNQ